VPTEGGIDVIAAVGSASVLNWNVGGVTADPGGKFASGVTADVAVGSGVIAEVGVVK
jgi:hypothetical protein